MQEFLVAPEPGDPRLTRTVVGIDHEGRSREARVVVERPLTIYLNSQEVVTAMTVGAHPDWLAVGYLANQNMLRPDDEITAVDIDETVDAAVVRTARETDYEARMRRRVRTSGCAVGTVFADTMESFEAARLPPDPLHTSWIYTLSAKISRRPSLYLAAGAIHGCVLCERDRPLLYLEDVGRHNAVDMIAGYMRLNGLSPAGKLFFTTGRLTSEMVIKTVQMGLPILISRSGFTASGVELARRADLTLVGRAKGKRFVALSGIERLVFDADPAAAGAGDA